MNALRQLIAGVINRQTRCVLKDPYANAFYKDETKISDWKSDATDMKPGVHERKWEIDSLCYTIRLAYGYWKTTGDISPFDEQWQEAVLQIPQTFREQQRKHGRGPYHFQRNTTTPTDSLPGGGYGNPAKPVGLIFSMFRPSDDATVFPFLVPSNFFAVVSLRQAAEMLEQIRHAKEPARGLPRAGGGSGRGPAPIRRGQSLGIWQTFTPTRWMPSAIPTALTTATFPACFRCLIWARSQADDPLYAAHAPVCVVFEQSLLLQRQSRRRPGRAARRHGHDLAAGHHHARADQHGRRGNPRLPGDAAQDARRHGFHARGLPQGRPEEIHPFLVRLGQHHFRRIGPEDISGAAAFAGLNPHWLMRR